MITQRRIFISSTIDDLSGERQELLTMLSSLSNDFIQFIPQLSEIPESFSFSEHDMRKSNSVEICLKNVACCDYYVLLIKDNYHYSRKYRCSITELEYNHAKKHNKPVFVFVFESNDRKRGVKAFIERVSKEKWRYKVDSAKEAATIISNILPKDNQSSLIAETIPDGIIMKTGRTFTKSWTLKNTGNVVWKECELKHISHISIMTPNTNIIKLPIVYPGQEVTFEVEYVCKYEGTVKSIWKMFDKEGEECFPERLGIWTEIKIIR